MEQPRARSSFVRRSWLRTCGVTRLFGRRSDRFAVNTATSQSPGGTKGRGSSGSVILVVRKERPDDAGVLGGKSYRGDVVGPAVAQALDPSALGIGALWSDPQYGAGAVDEQRSQVDVAVFGDGPETLFAAGGMLSWRESEPSCELSAVLEDLGVADSGHDGRCGERADALELHQSLGGVTGASQRGDAAIVVGDAGIEFGELSGGIGEDLTGDPRHPVVSVLQDLRQAAP